MKTVQILKELAAETGTKKEHSQTQCLQHQSSNLEFNQAMIAKRNEDIRKIENTVRQVNEVFQSIAELSAEQGMMINTIENLTITSEKNTEKALTQLVEAKQYQKSLCRII